MKKTMTLIGCGILGVVAVLIYKTFYNWRKNK